VVLVVTGVKAGQDPWLAVLGLLVLAMVASVVAFSMLMALVDLVENPPADRGEFASKLALVVASAVFPHLLLTACTVALFCGGRG
jgi:uncharacterized membrane-anchored protein